MNSAVIVAGGSGVRLGEKIPKQFIKINGKEILAYSVETFYNHKLINEVIIVSHPSWFDIVTKKYKYCKVVKGGKRRQDSSLNGILKTNDNTKNILIHDAARPFITSKIITKCIEELNYFDGIAPAVNISSSIIKYINNKASYIDRKQILEVQTPQCFKKNIIFEALSSNIEATDEIGMVLRKLPKAKLNFIDGDINNKKITSKLDLNYFKIIKN